MMQATILTLFPEMFPGTLGHSLAGKALSSGLWACETVDIRDFATDKHHTVDEKSYGGGTGLVMKPDVIGAAIEHAQAKNPNAQLIYTTPRGVPFNQELAGDLATNDLIVLCGRYEGVDQRVLDKYQPLEVSLGDYVLSGGEVAAQVMLDACIRLIPGVISTEHAVADESFSNKNNGLLEYPQYTQPPSWAGLDVPEVLLSGNHKLIEQWRQAQSLEITQKRRPDLLNDTLDAADK